MKISVFSSDKTICRRCFSYFPLSVYDSLTHWRSVQFLPCFSRSQFLFVGQTHHSLDLRLIFHTLRLFPSFVTITSMRMKFQWSSGWCLLWIIQFFSASCIRSSFKFALFAPNDYCLNIVSLLMTGKKNRQYKNQEEKDTQEGSFGLVIFSLRRCLTVTEKVYFVCSLLQSLLLPFYDDGNRHSGYFGQSFCGKNHKLRLIALNI